MLNCIAPDGVFFEHVTIHDIAHILSLPDAQWICTDASLFSSNSKDRIVFWKEPAHGIFLMHTQTRLAPYVGDLRPSIVYHLLDGKPIQTPSSCYVTIDLAMRILSHYLETGLLLTPPDWRNIDEVIQTTCPHVASL